MPISKNPKKIPVHLAIIMDGNGRWAQKKGLPRLAGHKEGIKSVETAIKTSVELGIGVLTLFVFSSENWQRPKKEISYLFGLLKLMLKQKYKLLKKNEIKLRISGSRDKVDKDLLNILDDYVKKLSKNKKMILNLAFNYGSRQEIIYAVNKILKTGKKSVTEKDFENYLYTKGLPAPDLIIRTSGEQRMSNFLLWQSAYSELYFTKTLWPDFREKDLYKAISNYQKRTRKFGGL